MVESGLKLTPDQIKLNAPWKQFVQQQALKYHNIGGNAQDREVKLKEYLINLSRKCRKDYGKLINRIATWAPELKGNSKEKQDKRNQYEMNSVWFYPKENKSMDNIKNIEITQPSMVQMIKNRDAFNEFLAVIFPDQPELQILPKETSGGMKTKISHIMDEMSFKHGEEKTYLISKPLIPTDLDDKDFYLNLDSLLFDKTGSNIKNNSELGDQPPMNIIKTRQQQKQEKQAREEAKQNQIDMGDNSSIANVGKQLSELQGQGKVGEPDELSHLVVSGMSKMGEKKRHRASSTISQILGNRGYTKESGFIDTMKYIYNRTKNLDVKIKILEDIHDLPTTQLEKKYGKYKELYEQQLQQEKEDVAHLVALKDSFLKHMLVHKQRAINQVPKLKTKAKGKK